VSRTDAGREFHVDGAAVVKARLRNDVLLNGVCSSGMDDEWSDGVTTCHNVSTQERQR